MNKIFPILIFLISTNIFCQNSQIDGQITLTDLDTDYSSLIILLVNNDSIIAGANANQKGYFKLIHKVPNGNYSLKIKQIGTRDFFIDSINVIDGKDINLKILYPGECKYKKAKKPKCIYNHYDNIIPIVYGFPNDKMSLNEAKGKIYLGGCQTYGCDPNYYCKIHKIEF
jgi:hypothetical protein